MIKKAMTKFGLATVVALVTASPLALASSGGSALKPANTRVDNIASLQRGAQLYFNYCIGCHSLQFMRYSRIGEDLKLSEDQVMQNLNFTGAKYGETIHSSMPAEDAARWFGKAPPDLSLEARAKGPDWIYNYLKSFYVDPARPVGWNNTVFPGASMPNVLWELQGVQHATFEPKEKKQESCSGEEGGCKNGQREVEHCKAGTTEIDGKCLVHLDVSAPGKLSAQEYDEAARDLTAFLQYVAEPAALKRQSLGVWVVLYLAFFTFLAWLLKKEYWKDVH
jgi:ubiquinol-cytochrome c reductase cytochrome c1 subunit